MHGSPAAPELQVYRDGATRDFIEAVREGRSSLLTAEEHRQVLSTALAAQISGHEDRVIKPIDVP